MGHEFADTKSPRFEVTLLKGLFEVAGRSRLEYGAEPLDVFEMEDDLGRVRMRFDEGRG